METDVRLAAELEAIEELHQRDIAATRACDVETLIELCTEDVVALAPGQPATVGRQAGRHRLEAGRARLEHVEILEYTQQWEEVHVLGEYAFEWGSFQSTVRSRHSGTVAREYYKILRVLRRGVDGSWKVHRTIWNEAPAALGGAHQHSG